LPIILTGERPKPGPATATYYKFPESFAAAYPDLDVTPRIRSELSEAYSSTYLLKPHAVVLSYLDNEPVDQYTDPNAISDASRLYDLPQTPMSDLTQTKACIDLNWSRYYDAASREVHRLHTLSATTNDVNF